MLGHLASGEQGPIRLWLLKIYAKHEVFVLRVFYRLIKGNAMRNRLVRECLYHTLAYPMARWGVSGTVISPEDLETFVSSLPPGRIAVGPCRCRLAHGACDHPLETDIVIKTGFPIWMELFPEDYREITSVEALSICGECHELGVAQIIYSHMDIFAGERHFVLCNCCKDGCVPLMAMNLYGCDRIPFNKGLRHVSVDQGKCRACGTCVRICPFGARHVLEGSARVGDCFGCGLCASHCPEGASVMA